jgi:hypothetical protein
MALLVHLEQLRCVHVRIALRGAEARVPEQFLNGAQVGAALKEVGGERMPERVRADAQACAARGDVAAHQAVDASDGQTSAAVVHEQRLAGVGQAGTA